MDKQVWDAIIVGAGPAGAVCAFHLAKLGHQVLILEKESWPRYKTCGGGLIWRARNRLDVDIDGVVEQQTYRAELHMNDIGAVHAVARPSPLVSMTMRAELDGALVAAACRAGAVLQPVSKVTHLEHSTESLVVDAGRQRFSARYLVAADGAAGAIAKLSGWPDHRRLVPAIESEISVDSATLQRFDATARFDFGQVPAGYGWVFPKADHLSVGCLSYQSDRPDLPRHLNGYLASLQIQPLQRQDHGFVIPVRPRSKHLARGRVLLTGDAAGFADPVTCEGISNAIWSGRLAAEAIAEHGSAATAVATAYQRSLRSSILGELRFARFFAFLLYRAPRCRRLAFRRLGQPLSEAMAEIIFGDLTYRDLLTSPRRHYRAARGIIKRTTGTYPNG